MEIARSCCSNSEIAEHEIGDDAARSHLRESGETTTDPCSVRGHSPHWHGRRIPTRDTSVSNFRCTRGPPRKSADTIASWPGARGGETRCPAAQSVSTRQIRRRSRPLRGLAASTGAECLLRSFVARGALTLGPIAVAGDLAEQVAAHPASVSQGGHPLWRTNITICLIEAERYAVADDALSRAIRHAERVGSPDGWRARFGCAVLRGIGPAICAPRKPTVGPRVDLTD